MVTMQFYINSINSGRNQGQRQKGIDRIYGMYVSMLFPFGEFKPKFFSQLSWQLRRLLDIFSREKIYQIYAYVED